MICLNKFEMFIFFQLFPPVENETVDNLLKDVK